MRRQTLTQTLTARLLLWGGLSLSTVGFAQTPTSAPPPAQKCALPTGTVPTESRAVFLLDTSGSMRGLGDGRANIFGRVKESVARYVNETKPNQVRLITFDSGVRGERSYELPAQAEQLSRDLGGLQADGNNTYLYRSMHSALSPLSASDRYVTNVFVLTDGIDNDPQPKYSAEGALASFGARGTLDTLSYVALGSAIPKEAKNALAASDYASGITVPVGEVPELAQLTGGTRVETVTDPRQVPAPFADGTPLTLAAQSSEVKLGQSAAAAGQTQLSVARGVPVGSVAVLCAPPPENPSVVGPRTRRVLLKFASSQQTAGATASDSSVTLTPPPAQAVAAPAADTRGGSAGQAGQGDAPGGAATGQRGSPAAPTTVQTTTVQTTTVHAPSTPGASVPSLTWLNPGASVQLARGQETVLRYRASPDLDLDGAQLLLPTGLVGLEAQLERQPGARDFAVRVGRADTAAADGVLTPALPSGLLTPRLLLGTGQVINLTPVQVAGLEPAPAQTRTTTLGVSPAAPNPGLAAAKPQTVPPTGTAAGTQTSTTQTSTAQTSTAQTNAAQTPGAQTTQTTTAQTTTQPGTAAGTPQSQNGQTGQTGQMAQTDQATQTAPATQTAQTNPAQNSTATGPALPWWMILLGVLLLAVIGIMLFALLRKREPVGTGTMAAAAVKGNRPPPPAKRVTPAPVPVPAAAPVAVAGAAAAAPLASRIEALHYRDDRTLALVGLNGETRGIPSPLSGPFDLGQVSRAAELRGLRAEQLHDGLQLVQIPEDLIVSQDTRLLSSGDLVVPGTLLSVIAAAPGNLSQHSLGSLAGLGRPLMLRANGAHLEITGPYGDHILNLTPGILDLGDLLEAPALRGLRLSTRGYRILLTDVPAHLSVAPSGEHVPLKPGMYLPERAGLLLRGL